MNYFENIPPGALASIVALWIIREVFGFVTKMVSKRNGNGDPHIKAIEMVCTHIQAQTDLVKDMTRELSTLRHHVIDLKDDIRQIPRH